jgi:hypothetical protein
VLGGKNSGTTVVCVSYSSSKETGARGGCDPHEEREKTALGRTGDVRTQLTPVLCYYPVVCMLHQYCISASLSFSLLPVVGVVES